MYVDPKSQEGIKTQNGCFPFKFALHNLQYTSILNKKLREVISKKIATYPHLHLLARIKETSELHFISFDTADKRTRSIHQKQHASQIKQSRLTNIRKTDQQYERRTMEMHKFR